MANTRDCAATAGDVPRALAEEPLDRGIQELAVGLRGREQRVELGVEAREQVGVEQTLDDHRAVGIERGDDVPDRVDALQVGERGHDRILRMRDAKVPY